MKYQLISPQVHHRNAVEQTIRTIKNHLITGLCTCDLAFPVSLWARLLPQADITLNLLRSSRRNPSLYAQATMFGDFIFTSTPLANPGTKILVHLNPDKRNIFGAHDTDGRYVGPSIKHYRYYNYFILETGGIRHAETLESTPHQVPFLKVTTYNYLRQATTDILTIFQSSTNISLPTNMAAR